MLDPLTKAIPAEYDHHVTTLRNEIDLHVCWQDWSIKGWSQDSQLHKRFDIWLHYVSSNVDFAFIFVIVIVRFEIESPPFHPLTSISLIYKDLKLI